VFLHSEWRTGSTYLWTKLGRAEGAIGFYEPFNESLATLDQTSLQALRPDNWASGHSGPPQPYFAEYARLLAEGGGVTSYAPSFAYEDHYSLDPRAVPPQWVYLRSLLDLAEAEDRRAVLGFCRSLGRMPWLRARFPDALHVWVRRDPMSQWLSGWRLWQETGNAYFVAGYPLITAVATGHPYLEAVAREHLVPAPPSRKPSELFPFYVDWAGRQTPETLFRLFWHVHTVNEHRAEGRCDLVIDIDRLGSSPDYAAATSTALAEHGLTVTFDDVAIPRREADDLAEALERARTSAQEYTAMWLGNGAVL
jgi:hypothetical protein